MRSRAVLGLVVWLCVVASAQAAPMLDLALQPTSQTVGFSEVFTMEIWAQADTAIATAYFDVDYSADLINATSVDLESILNFFPETGTLSSGHISLVGGGTVAGFGGGAAVKIGTINFTSLAKVGTADISLAFTTDDECALVGGGALPESDIGFGSAQVTVPEPTGMVLLFCGLTGLFLRRRAFGQGCRLAPRSRYSVPQGEKEVDDE